MKTVITAIVGLVLGLAGGFMAGRCGSACPLLGGNTTAQTATAENPTPDAVSAIEAKTRPVIENIIAAIAEKNYEKFMQDFQPELKNLLPESQFQKITLMYENPLGGLARPEFFGSYHKGNTTVTLWRSRAKNTGDDELLTLSLVEHDGSYRVVGFFIQ